MQLFDDKPRLDLIATYKRQSKAELDAGWWYGVYDLAESAEPIRKFLQECVDRYPKRKRRDAMRSMRAADSVKSNFRGVVFELFIHEFLLANSTRVEVEPSFMGKTPDFRVTESSVTGDSFEYIVEATVKNYEDNDWSMEVKYAHPCGCCYGAEATAIRHARGSIEKKAAKYRNIDNLVITLALSDVFSSARLFCEHYEELKFWRRFPHVIGIALFYPQTWAPHKWWDERFALPHRCYFNSDARQPSWFDPTTLSRPRFPVETLRQFDAAWGYTVQASYGLS